MANENTTHLNLPLPHPDNLLEGDVHRLRESLGILDGNAADVDATLQALHAAVEVAKAAAATAQAAANSAQTSANAAALKTTTIATTAPLTGGGDLQANRTFSVAAASTTSAGVVVLNDAVNSTSTVQAATANAAKKAYDQGSAALTAANAAQATADAALTATPDVYYLCEFYSFRHPTLRPGFQPAHGGVIDNAATLYPKAWAYLQTEAGQKLCITESQWQNMVNAVWHTNADGSRAGWNGIGGAPFYVQDTANGTLRMPDLRGMYVEAAGFDSLGVGGVHGDGGRNAQGQIGQNNYHGFVSADGMTGPFYNTGTQPDAISSQSGRYSNGFGFDLGRVMPVAAKFQPRAWGSLACVYLGQPTL